MSLKAIEMQIALPRTQDAGKVQEQLNQRGQISQDQATVQVEKEQKLKRTSVIKNESMEKVWDKKDKEENNHKNQHHRSKNQKDEDTQEIKHPFKGTKIDFSG